MILIYLSIIAESHDTFQRFSLNLNATVDADATADATADADAENHFENDAKMNISITKSWATIGRDRSCLPNIEYESFPFRQNCILFTNTLVNHLQILFILYIQTKY